MVAAVPSLTSTRHIPKSSSFADYDLHIFRVNENRIVRLFVQLILPIKYVYHILKSCIKIIVWN